MKKLFAFVAMKIEQRILAILVAAVDTATEEALAMFPTWWDNGPNIVADAGARRLLQGEDFSEGDVAMLVGFTRMAAMRLAIDARAQMAMTEIVAKWLPSNGGLRDEVLESMGSNDDQLIVEMRRSVANYGINTEALEAHFVR